jgi:hypothetical protein
MSQSICPRLLPTSIDPKAANTISSTITTTRTSTIVAHASRATSTLASKMPFPTATTIAQPTQTVSKPLALSTAAKALTRFLFGEAPLPPFLQQYGRLVMLLTGSAAMGSGVYYFIQQHRHSRQKIQLAMFHVIRLLGTLEDLDAHLEDPHEILEVIDREIKRMVDMLHLTEAEGDAVKNKLKRSVFAMADAQEIVVPKKRRHSAPPTPTGVRTQRKQARQDARGHLQRPHPAVVPHITVTAPSQDHQQLPSSEDDIQAQLHDEEVDIDMPDAQDKSSERTKSRVNSYDDGVRVALPIPSPDNHPPTSSTRPPPSSQSRSTYKFPSSSDEVTPTPAPRLRNPTPRRGVGLANEADELYSMSPSPSASPESPPRNKFLLDEELRSISRDHERFPASSGWSSSPEAPEVTRQPPRKSTPYVKKSTKHVSYVQEAINNAFEAHNRVHTPTDPFAVPRPLSRATRPSSIASILRPPPRDGTGTVLHSITEGLSPHESPAPGTTQYRINETRKFTEETRAKRDHRRAMRTFLEQEEDEHTDTIAVAQGRLSVDTFDAALLDAQPETPPRHRRGHTSSSAAKSPAPRKNTPSTQKLSSSSALSSARSLSPIVLVNNAARASTPSPEPVTPAPKKMRGRPRKTATTPQTPVQREALATERTSRQSRYTGKYTQ